MTKNSNVLVVVGCLILAIGVSAQCGPNGDIPACGNGYCPDRFGNCPEAERKQGGPPGGGGGGGGGGTSDTTSTECTTTSGTCSNTGSSNNIYRHLTYSSSTGKFTGTLVTNGCPDHTFYGSITPSCISVTFPATAYTTGPKAAPTLGRLGLLLAGGTNVYGPYEAGFSAGFACTVSADGGSCVAGLDVATCEAELLLSCTNGIKTELFMDACGGHANPYHHHTDPVCKYDKTDLTKHSPLIGVALDGYGIYGVWEAANSYRPCVDYCHGHSATVPGSDTWSLTTSSAVYHYHTYDTSSYPAVWTIGCFGPVTTLAQCKALYTTCGDDTTTVYTIDYPNGISVDLYCPCFDVPACGFVSTTVSSSASPSLSNPGVTTTSSLSSSASVSASHSSSASGSTSHSSSASTSLSSSASPTASLSFGASPSPAPSTSPQHAFASCGSGSRLNLKALQLFSSSFVASLAKDGVCQ